MQVWVKISMWKNANDNTTSEYNQQDETARILSKLAKTVKNAQFFSDGIDIQLKDVNGNEVGFLGVYDEPKCLTNETPDYNND